MSKITTTVSPVLAALLVAEDAARIVADTHQCDDNDNARCLSQYAIAHHPAETLGELKTKLEFMVKHKMGDGMDWLPTILEDVQRINPIDSLERSKVLEQYEDATAECAAALTAYNVAEDAHNEDSHVEAVKAFTAADARLAEALNRQNDAIRALILIPAPSLSALMVNMQIALDTDIIGFNEVKTAMAADLRRFSNYADKEA